MRSRKHLTLIAVVLLILAFSQTSKTTSNALLGPPPDQISFLSAARTDTTVSTSFVNVPAGLTLTTTQHRTFLVQFFTSARVTVPGEHLELRATVDGVPVGPLCDIRGPSFRAWPILVFSWASRQVFTVCGCNGA